MSIVSVEQVEIIGDTCLWQCCMAEQSQKRPLWLSMQAAANKIREQGRPPTYRVKFFLGPKLRRRKDPRVCRTVFWNNDIKQGLLFFEKDLETLGLLAAIRRNQ